MHTYIYKKPPSLLFEMNRFNEGAEVSLYLSSINFFKTINKTDERQHIQNAQDGSLESLEFLIKSHQRFVVSCAKRFAFKGVAMLDLIAHGNLGLIRAIESFNLDYDTRLLTYAETSIIYEISKAWRKQHAVMPVTVRLRDTIKAYNRIEAKLTQEGGRKASLYDIASAMKLSYEALWSLLNFYCQISSANAYSLLDNNHFFLSDKTALEDIASSEASVVSDSIKQEEKKTLQACISKLACRSQEIVNRRFGLKGYKQHTLEEIGQSLSLSRERVRQVLDMILPHLKELLENRGLTEESIFCVS